MAFGIPFKGTFTANHYKPKGQTFFLYKEGVSQYITQDELRHFIMTKSIAAITADYRGLDVNNCSCKLWPLITQYSRKRVSLTSLSIKMRLSF